MMPVVAVTVVLVCAVYVAILVGTFLTGELGFYGNVAYAVPAEHFAYRGFEDGKVCRIICNNVHCGTVVDPVKAPQVNVVYIHDALCLQNICSDLL